MIWGPITDTSKRFFENCALLGYNAVSSGNYLPMFQDNLLVPSSWILDPWRWDWHIVPKHQTGTSTTHRAITQKSALFIYFILKSHKRFFLFSRTSWPAPWPTQPPVQLVQGSFYSGYSSQDMKLIIHLPSRQVKIEWSSLYLCISSFSFLTSHPLSLSILFLKDQHICVCSISQTTRMLMTLNWHHFMSIFWFTIHSKKFSMYSYIWWSTLLWNRIVDMTSKPGITKQSQGQGTHHWLQVWELNRGIHGRHPLALKIVQHIATFMLRPLRKTEK